MVQQYGGQPQYGAPPPQYGQPPGAAPQAQPEIKWSGLNKGGSFKVPVIAFIGRLTDMVYDAQSSFGLRIVEKYDQVQILESPVPWPWAAIELSIKYSDRENSGWGKHVESAKQIGIAQNVATLEQAKTELVGKVYEMRQVHENYGEDKDGKSMTGDVWRFVRIMGAGQGQAPAPQPQYAQPPQYVPPLSVPVVPAPVPQSAQTTGFSTQLLPTDTAPIRAKKLLHGRMLNEWLGVALLDDKIKADPGFINSVYDQSFIVGLKASGQVVLGADGKFQVIS